MNEDTGCRWDAFTPMELQALDELLRSFGPLRPDSPDVAKLSIEITAAMERRKIRPFAPVDSPPLRRNSQ